MEEINVRETLLKYDEPIESAVGEVQPTVRGGIVKINHRAEKITSTRI